MILLQGLNLSPVKANHAGPKGFNRVRGLRGTSAISSNEFKLGRSATWTIGQPIVNDRLARVSPRGSECVTRHT